MVKLGKLVQVDLRTQWKNEASDFTVWLAKEENLKELGKIINIDEIELIEVESDVGDFNVDILPKMHRQIRKLLLKTN